MFVPQAVNTGESTDAGVNATSQACVLCRYDSKASSARSCVRQC